MSPPDTPAPTDPSDSPCNLQLPTANSRLARWALTAGSAVTAAIMPLLFLGTETGSEACV